VNGSPRRLTALLCAMLLLLSAAGDVFGAHPCPHHAAIGAPEHARAMEHGSASGHGTTDAHHGHAPSGTEQAPAAEHDGHASCTCGGVCPISTGPVPPAAPGLVHLPFTLPYAAPAAHPDPTGLPSRLAAHLLPFAQAPPRSA